MMAFQTGNYSSPLRHIGLPAAPPANKLRALSNEANQPKILNKLLSELVQFPVDLNQRSFDPA
jgi:hypothetical protein